MVQKFSPAKLLLHGDGQEVANMFLEYGKKTSIASAQKPDSGVDRDTPGRFPVRSARMYHVRSFSTSLSDRPNPCKG